MRPALFWSLALAALALVGVLALALRTVPPCQDGADYGRGWYGQRCVPYCPPDPKECG